MANEQARFHRRVVNRQALDQHCADRKHKVTIFLRHDLRIFGNGHPTLLGGAIRPQRAIDTVGNRARRRGLRIGRVHTTGLRQQGWKFRRSRGIHAFLHELSRPLGIRARPHDVQLTVMALDEAMWSVTSHSPNTAALRIAIGIEKQGPNMRCIGIAVHISTDQPWELTATVHKTPDNRGTFIMIVQRNRRNQPAQITAGIHAIVALRRFPAVVATLNHQIDFFPVVTSHVAGPQVTGLPVKAKAPWIAQTPGVDFLPNISHAHQRIVCRNSIRLLAIDIDAQDRATQGG